MMLLFFFFFNAINTKTFYHISLIMSDNPFHYINYTIWYLVLVSSW